MGEMVYLTSGYRIERWPSLEDGLHRLAFHGIRGGYLGLLQYRDEDVEKIVGSLTTACTRPPDLAPDSEPHDQSADG